MGALIGALRALSIGFGGSQAGCVGGPMGQVLPDQPALARSVGAFYAPTDAGLAQR